MSDDVVRLNIGAGDVPIDGFTSVDRKNGQEAYPLGYADDSVDEIRASHILEHFGHSEVALVLQDWIRALKPGGRIRLSVPDFAVIAERYHRRLAPSKEIFGYVFGGQVDEDDFHRSGYNETSLRSLMQWAGLERIDRWCSNVDDCAQLPISLNLEGYKRPKREPVDLPKIVALMSTAKLAFTENMFCAVRTFQPRRVEIIKATGVYWGQCLERIMAMAIRNDAEWVVTLDYDTVFMPEHFDELCYLMATHPEADAIAPLQMKRDSNDALLWVTSQNGEHCKTLRVGDFEEPITPIDTAHFGLTLIRVEALKKMPHPWFHAQPNADGEWEDKRIDEDIYFWQQWKKRGNTLYLASHVPIGHLQQVATWPSHEFRPIHQFTGDFYDHGAPLDARR
jgi:SAM-dependent methyltransferase